MKRFVSSLLALLLALSLLPGPALAADAAALEHMEADAAYDGYLVKLPDGAQPIQLMHAEAGVEPLRYAEGYYRADSLEAAQALAAAWGGAVEPNYIVELYDSTPVDAPAEGANDALLEKLDIGVLAKYGLTGKDLDSSIDMGGDGQADQIVVAVIDSGLDPDHEDIDYRQILPGKNFLADQPEVDNTADQTGHGTFITGEILATAGNGKGIDGIACGLYVLPVRVFSSNTTSMDIILDALAYATQLRTQFDATKGEEGVNVCVLNLSFGTDKASDCLESAIDAAIDAGIIVVCAAGNDGDTKASYPAQYAIGVGSVDTDLQRSPFSQTLSEANGTGWENKVWVTAMGEAYTSLWYDGKYCVNEGTSFSCPQVAALAAIALSVDNDLTDLYADEAITSNHAAFQQLLKDTAHPLGSADSGTQDRQFGWGLVQYGALLRAVLPSTPTVRFQVTDSTGLAIPNPTITLTRASDNTPLTPNEDGSFSVMNGTYTYSISAEGYVTASDSIIVTDQDQALTVELVAQPATFFIRFTVSDEAGQPVENPAITLTRASDNTPLTPNEDGSFSVTNGTYTYSISAEGYVTASDSITVTDQDQALPVKLKAVETGGETGGGETGGGSGGIIGGGGSPGGGGGTGSGSEDEGDEADEDVETQAGAEDGQYDDVVIEHHALDDVAESDWYYEPVNFVMTLDLFQGTAPQRFSPDAEMTRAMLVTVLFRLSGEQAPDTAQAFPDVDAGAYHAQAAAWGQATGIVTGTDSGNFNPDAAVTREQLAAMLYRYAQWAGLEPAVSGDGAALAFPDYGDVSAYAETAIDWAWEQGIVTGNTQGLLRPSDGATRAEVAAMLMRFLQNVL